MEKINIANDYTVYPGGRTEDDGPFSGARFRDTILIPALASGDKVEVNFDGTRGYGTSFLEEIFGGIVRKGYTKKYLDSHLILISEKEDTLKKVQKYIEAAEKKEPRGVLE